MPTRNASDAVTQPTQASPIPRAPLRVVYIDHTARLSGAELALWRLIHALGDTVEAHVILGEDGPLVPRLRDAGASVEVVPLGTRARDLAREHVTLTRLPAAGALGAARWSARLLGRLRALRPDLVHTYSLKSGVAVACAARVARVPVVWHVNDRVADDYLPAPAVRLVRRLLGLLPAAVIANSETTRATLGSLRRPIVRVIGCVVTPSPSAHDPSEPMRRVGIVGRLAPWKGQDVFLEAFSRAFPDGGMTAAIVGAPLFGEDAYERSLHELAARLGIGRRVEFRGFRDDVDAELARLGALVHASVIPEPFGQVVVEGMAAGVPVIASASGGPEELVTDGIDGLLVPVRDADALADALRRLETDPELRIRLAEGGRRRARDFAPDRIAGSVLDVYRAVLARPSSEAR